ncbi:helix-turn-helix domain-containing protein [Paenibacillus taiwanensis]|uniref:helix-turn-helix domain-containing protein n=1 Tax=Paenibacillus taiwanensis TaxID=401638 RepID=UPI00041F6ED8|nr:helix-turn-helix domain-containing protein [Paenibacillus taiwanensis]
MLQFNSNWLAHCTEIKDLAKSLFQTSTIHLDRAALLLITDGQTTLSINGHKEHIVFGHFIALEAGAVIQLSNTNRLDFSGYLLSLVLYDTEMKSTCNWFIDTTNGYYMQRVPEAVIADIRLSLAQNIDHLHITLKQFIVYSLLKELHQERSADEYTLEQRIEHTVIYMHKKYNQMMTRDELAAIAGYSPWYYSRKFIELYDQTPIAYLIRYRIFRAQEMLLTTDDLSQNIAKKVGFDDVQNFSRQFRRVVGRPPKQFKNKVGDYRICFLSPAHAEIAIALGVVPNCVTVTSSLTPKYQQVLFHEAGTAILQMPQYVIQQDIIVQQQPDLIIGVDLTEETKQHFQTIAPVITGLPYDLNALIRYFGQLFNKENEAAQIIHELTVEVDALKNKIQHYIAKDATVLYLRVEELGYRYVGESSSDSAILLYEELGLQMPELLRANKNSFNTCSLQQLVAANPTYLFIEKRIMDYYTADLSLATLQKSGQWANLDAVKNKRVFYVDTGLWINNCSVFGKREIMKQIEQLIVDRVCPKTQ